MSLIFVIISLLIAITVHEATHALIAYKLGDSTAKIAGRLTLNPLAHLDPLGTIAMILIHFGWGKPVPVNPNNFKRPALDNFLVAISGPASNLIMATISGLVLRISAGVPVIFAFFATLAILNVFLAIFNLLPIPPLDGSKIWNLVLSQESYYTLERMGPIILFAFILFIYSTGGAIFGYIQSAIVVVSHILGIPGSVLQ